MIAGYTASKGGVGQLTKVLSTEWAGRGVNVNAIAPGYMVTELTANIKEVNPEQYNNCLLYTSFRRTLPRRWPWARTRWRSLRRR